MKFCSHCGAEIRDEAIMCPKCGCTVTVGTVKSPKSQNCIITDDCQKTQNNKYCTYCGAEVLKEAVVCPKCGCPVKFTAVSTDNAGSGLQTAAKVFMVLGCVGFALLACLMAIVALSMLSIIPDLCTVYLILATVYLIPLIWAVPMTQHYFKFTQKKEQVSIAFKVCTLLFVNLIAGILMLCDNTNNKRNFL